MTGTTTSVTNASCAFSENRMAAMPATITTRRAEFISALSRNSSRFPASSFRMVMSSPVCLSSKNAMSRRCILSNESVRTACMTPCANRFALTPYTHVNAAVAANAPTMSATENQNWASSPAGIHDPGTNGSVYAPPSRLNTASMAVPRTSGGSRDANRATVLATIPTTNHRRRSVPYSRNSRRSGRSTSAR